MGEMERLERWAERLLDTGKRNNLINYKDIKTASAEVVFPDCEGVFSKCALGHTFELFDPKLLTEETDMETDDAGESSTDAKRLSRQEYIERYSGQIRKEKQLLVYAQTPNPLTAVKTIAKRAQDMLDETGNNVAYLAFGFLRWNEKQGSETFFRAPLLLVHITITTGSVLDPIRIEVCDDDIVVNPTFSYLLQAEYGLTLPQFGEDDTLSGYYDKVTALVSKLNWSVLNECKLGVFSFLKINMYEDLKKNAETVLSNPNVQALFGNISPDAEIMAGNGQRVENELIDLHTVVDADSSQIDAIEMAKSGRSFVLQGPPGTGKSQTITNIIAECLHDGKKVLFVSEKQAALNVVYDKLKKADLADFCLELHSHKANKKAVIDELNRTLETPKSAVSSRAEEEIRQKRAAQSKLDGYARQLHEKREGINRSLYQLLELYAAQRRFPECHVQIRDIGEKGEDYLSGAVELLEQYADYIPSVGMDYRKNPWYGFTGTALTYDQRNQLHGDLETLLQGYQALQTTTVKLKEKYETPELCLSDTLFWQSFLQFYGETDVLTPSMLTPDTVEQVYPHLSQMQELSERIQSMTAELREGFRDEIVQEIDGQAYHGKLIGQFSSFFSRLFNSEYKSMIGQMQLYSKTGGKLSYQQAVDCASRVMHLQSLNLMLDQHENAVGQYLGSGYRRTETDWPHVIQTVDRLKAYLGDSGSSLGMLSRMGAEQYQRQKAEMQTQAEHLRQELDSVSEARERVSKLFSKDGLDLEQGNYSACLEKLKGCLESFQQLGNWIGFAALLTKLREADLESYLDAAIQDAVAPEQIVGVYRRTFYGRWIENIIFTVPELASFSRTAQDQAVRVFAAKDELQYEISKVQIKSELSQRRPDLNMVTGGSAVAILRREGQKKRKQMPIRRLLAETGSLAQVLKPCFLMSPLSVSTYLDPEKIQFDTVVFDEASQIFPQDALGAIYRGKQLIVVGDSRQMPPSDFFSSMVETDTDDEDAGDVTDFESILDICSSVFPAQRLSWHYRSHYEQLIAFSNLHYYNNALITFPSSSKDHPGIGVDYLNAGGTFDRKSKTNRAEAEFIVDLIYKNMEEHPERSLGVVAFSVSQQTLIDRLLSKRRESDPSHEWFFRSDRPEPFFIKNLETVQGDERDTIIFSVAYARDSQGRFIHNFGPLNREGGERRLNVAVTRAKDNVQLVASIHHTDIDLNHSGSEGVRLLRAYLDYAENGEGALERAITVSGADQFDSDFEQEVCDFLRDNGFTVDTQIGCSGYRIDLGLRKPDSSEYVLAIECDGATYHSSKNARDRDRLRQQVLENMGWQFYRIWSTDWFRNGAVEKKRLLQAAGEALQRQKENGGIKQNKSAPPLDQAQTKKQFAEEIQKPQTVFPEYRALDAMEIVRKHSYNLQRAVEEMLKTEAPLSEEYLLKRIVSLFGREKVTKVVQKEFSDRMRLCENRGIIRRNGFLYLEGAQDYQLRIPGDRREIKYIAEEELSAGLYALIRQNVTASKDGLYKTLTNLLGFSRTGEAAATRYDAALNRLLEHHLVVQEDQMLMVREG